MTEESRHPVSLPLEIVRALRDAAHLQHKPSRVTALELDSLARSLELWAVHYRHQLTETGPRATPTNLRALASALDEAATVRKPHERIKNVAASLRRLAESLKKELAP